MKKSVLSFVLMLSTVGMVAQTTAETFKQPYSLGDKFSPNLNFSGDVWLAVVSKEQSLEVPMVNVTFAPACRNSWHTHSGGQILIATAGVGYYQERGKVARKLFAGDIVEIPAGVEHWHGAAPDSWFAHLAIAPHSATNSPTWLLPLTDEEYLTATQETESKYKEENKSLSEREQAIVNIGVYTGKGDLEHLAPALSKALEVGMTINEVKEILIHSYAYAGFPRSLRAIQTLMQVVDERKAQGKNDILGREAFVENNKTGSKYEQGKDRLAMLTGVPATDTLTGYAAFAPTIDKFLKEHLFADIFERDLLTWRERELATVSILAGVGGVEPMAYGHMSICLNLGITKEQLTALLNIVEINLGESEAKPLRNVLNSLTTTQQ